jgi:hypothetical protein
MQRILVSAWIVFIFAVILSIAAQAQESHPIYDNSPVSGEASRPIYDSAGPIYDNTRPPPASNATGIGRSINSLQAVQADLIQSPPDVAGRREKALAHVNAALKELRDVQKAGQ